MLQENSLIVSLSVSQWTGRKHDKTITNEVHKSHNASDDAGRYNKLLVRPELFTMKIHCLGVTITKGYYPQKTTSNMLKK